MSTADVSSISLFKSFRDWWSFPTILQRAHGTLHDDKSKQSFEHARLNNILLEYDLFKDIFSDEVYLYPPDKVIASDDEVEARIVARFLDVDIGNGERLHEFCMEHKAESPNEEKTHIVIIHGYMAAIGYFCKNFEPLVRSKPGTVVHVIDLPGFGNSSRVKFPDKLLQKKALVSEKIAQIHMIEDWFTERIELWRQQRNIAKFKLISHSMGAYLSCCYLMKYNKAKSGDDLNGYLVTDFIVVSPMGTESSYASLLSFDQERPADINPLKELETGKDVSEEDNMSQIRLLEEKLGRPRFPRSILLRKLWEWNLSPFQLLQRFGPFYSKLLSIWSFKRFKGLALSTSSKDLHLELLLKLHDYSYAIFNQYQGSGELAITKLINHEVLARLPLADRGLIEYLSASPIKTLWMYGGNDWMNSKGGRHIHEMLRRKNTNSSYQIIENAGHHVYLDNPENFNASCIEFLDLC